MSKKKEKLPCVHGGVCREILSRQAFILSVNCPDGCRFYKEVDDKQVRKKPVVMGSASGPESTRCPHCFSIVQPYDGYCRTCGQALERRELDAGETADGDTWKEVAEEKEKTIIQRIVDAFMGC